jgi:alkanesulfonate monooxygenase SsuD/methylene tetrahydromethanopterin reductase-like flavin-dependent oxidoreductase (luciferase family)
MTETAISREMRAWFEAYLDAFNRSDFEAFGAYYAQDVAFHGQAARLDGREAVLDFYRGVKARLTETIELLSFVGAPGRIAAEIRTLQALQDWPDFPTGPLKAGDVRQSVNVAFYDIVDGRFARIRSARLSPRPEGGR